MYKPHIRTAPAAIASILLASAAYCSAQELIYQEGFNDDGEAATPKRYTTTGRDVYEIPRIRSELGNTDQLGPVYWAHNFEVSFVGVPAPTPARRMIFVWDSAIDANAASPEVLQLWDSSVKWLLNNKAGAKVVVSPDPTAIGILADRLTAAGYTVVADDTTVAEEQIESQGDLLIHAVGAPGSRGAKAKIPLIAMSSPDLDDLVVSSIGTATTFEAGNATIATPSHPAAGGKTGSFPAATGSFNWQLMGDQLPVGSTVLATLTRRIPPSVTGLASVDALIAGTKTSDKASNTVTTLDFSDASAGNYTDDNPLPGSVAGNWGLRVTGKLNVTTAGTYSFGIGSDDGGRLEIDIDKNGFGANDKIIESLGPQGHTLAYGNATFATAGVYDFQVVSYNSGGGGDVEVSVAKAAGAGKANLVEAPDEWELLGSSGATSAVKVQGALDATSYVATGETEETQVPFIVLLNGPEDAPPGAVFGGGPFTGFEGRGFFAMSGGNKWAYPPEHDTYRSLTLSPVNVAGKSNVKLTVAVAATFLDFETTDFLDIVAYPTGLSSEPVVLAHYSAPDGNTKYFVDTAHNNTHRLNLTFQDATYDIPAGATDLVIEFRAATTFWNEIVGFDNVRITSGTGGGGAPTVGIARNGTDLQVTFTGTLESAPAITGPWTAVPGASSPLVLKPAQLTTAAFYRAKQ
jgi:hypothetical protein